MVIRFKWAMVGLVAVTPLFMCSCLSMVVPKSPSTSGGDGRVVAAWELMYQVNDKGDEERPRETTRTTLEFTNEGRVLFTRMDSENKSHKKEKTGKFALDKGEITITDDAGNTVRLPYSIDGDKLVIVMPEMKKKFIWRRTK